MRLGAVLSNIAPGDQYSTVRVAKLEQWQAYMRRVSNYYDVSLFSHDDIHSLVVSFLSDE
jgi:membrane protein required for beta-lactamase induction